MEGGYSYFAVEEDALEKVEKSALYWTVQSKSKRERCTRTSIQERSVRYRTSYCVFYHIYIFILTRDFLALNVYVALCYYKLDYYDVSQEVLTVYLQSIPESTIALNLKACNHFRLYNGKAAEVKQLCMRLRSKQTAVHLHA
jgi:hypothetical protein